MRWILDACTLIYLVKSELFEKFHSLSDNDIHIDTSVYEEAVIEGKNRNCQDAFLVENILKKFKIPVIPVEIKEFYDLFHNPGETSTFILAKEDGVGITSDRRAYNKFYQKKIRVIKLEQFFFQKYTERKLDIQILKEILKKLEDVWAISSKEHLHILSKIRDKEEKI